MIYTILKINAAQLERLLKRKYKGIGKDLEQISLETVQMFYNDSQALGYSIL